MKKIICAFLYLLLGYTLYAQNKPVVTVPLAVREVSGIVRDSVAGGVEGAIVRLASSKDTLLTQTNEFGVFIFKEVKSAEFIITAGRIGFLRKSQKYLYNDTKARLILKPIILRTESELLKEVTIKGKVGPKYLTDTVEFWADDYIIRDYAKLEDLLRKMEGISVDKDGTVMHQGQEVKRAKFNGINYFGGDIKSAIKELPANIVERIQIIDDYGDQARATGVKTGESTKVLNVVSKADKSVGTMYSITAESNFDNRNYVGGSARHIDGYDQKGVNISIDQIPAGINMNAAVGTISGARRNYLQSSSSADGGKLSDLNGGLTYSKRINDKLTFESNYTFKKSKTNTSRSSLSEEYYNDGQVNGSRSSSNDNQVQSHRFNGVLDYSPSKFDKLKINADLGYNENKSLSGSQFLQTGAINLIQQTDNSGITKTPNYRAAVLYTHYFKKAGSNISMTVNSTSKKEEEERDDLNTFYNNTAGDNADRDYELHNLRTISRLNSNNSFQAVYSHPFGKYLKMGLTGSVTYLDFSNKQLVNSIDQNGQINKVDSLSRVFNYQTIETPLIISFNYNKNTWYEVSVGLKTMGNYMRGSFKTLKNVIQRDALNVMPNFTLFLRSSRKAELRISYNASVQQPSFEQILPIPDVIDPLNTRFGNTDLKSSFTHRPSITYNVYSAASGLNLQIAFAAGFTNDKVINSQILINDPKLGIRRETHFINSDGDYNLTSFYNIVKPFTNARYSVSLDGSVNYVNAISMNNGLQNVGKTFIAIQDINLNATPVHWLEINPGLKFRLNRTAFTLPGFSEINSTVTEFNTNGKLYFSKLWVFGFDAGKSLVRGLTASGAQNPFIVNMNIEKRMFKQKNGMLSLLLMDALKQNNLVSRNLTTNGFVDSRSNTNSRYFLLQFSWSPQSWSAGSNAGKARSRDGMFIN
ncbi:outer membrane beta-barrel protein [Pedobacter hiemivivus]|uniref:Outer membrane protein beta-barrel domain-containing protein n=1 Tax=Pedobacter hiemivivus TaxID=2530454 RepID=A0A4R0NF18_9SPHI|nr:outer membrane beta-barrel protein [Pedobacter hiemivivus]TCC97792.1 hypothetical protein EZ444_07735 [Pedobacter hiemivivus]